MVFRGRARGCDNCVTCLMVIVFSRATVANGEGCFSQTKCLHFIKVKVG
jgi:hypothetical protein